MANPERWLSFLVILLGAEGIKDDPDAVAVVPIEDQDHLIQERNYQCWTIMHNENTSIFTGPFCERVWDDIMCWPPTSAGTIQELPCPDYVNGFFVHRYATKKCTVNGTWYINPDTNQMWTNLTQCISNGANCIQCDIPGLIAEHMGRLRLMYNIGYGISLISLLLAVTIMLLFKKLHCPRNFVHINLFVSFILRAMISFVKENVLVNGVGFPSDIKIGPGGKLNFLDNGLHWECRLFFSIFNYILCANYMWIFAEGLYLHMLISVAVFSEKSSCKWLVLLGWGTPVLFVGPWVVVRATLENVLCWNTHPNHSFFWIIKGPICASVIINFVFFLNIIRVLFTKLTAFNAQEVGISRYRKLAKATLVLIPLFGVHYIVFIWLPDKVNETAELAKLYYEMFFNSFQGFIVSLLFCFLNGEVQAEFKKRWHRFKLRRNGNFNTRRGTRDTMVSFVSRGRDSVASTNGKDLINGNGKFISEERPLTQADTNSDLNIFKRANGHSQLSLENIGKNTEEIVMLENSDILCDGTNILDEDLV